MRVAPFRMAGYGGVVARVLRAGRFAFIGFAAVVVGTALTVAAVIGVVLLVLWLREPSAAAYARTHVQALFVSDLLRPTGMVKSCTKVGPGDEPGQAIWASGWQETAASAPSSSWSITSTAQPHMTPEPQTPRQIPADSRTTASRGRSGDTPQHWRRPARCPAHEMWRLAGIVCSA